MQHILLILHALSALQLVISLLEFRQFFSYLLRGGYLPKSTGAVYSIRDESLVILLFSL